MVRISNGPKVERGVHFSMGSGCLLCCINGFLCFVYFSIIEKGEESCTDLIEAHKECMRALGFKI